MSNGTREKQALGVFLILIVLSTFGIAWYMVAGHSWNVAASSIDEKVGQMEGYTSIVYAGTLPVQADAKTLDSQNGSDAQTDDEKDSTDTAEKTGGDTASGSGGASSSTGSSDAAASTSASSDLGGSSSSADVGTSANGVSSGSSSSTNSATSNSSKASSGSSKSSDSAAGQTRNEEASGLTSDVGSVAAPVPDDSEEGEGETDRFSGNDTALKAVTVRGGIDVAKTQSVTPQDVRTNYEEKGATVLVLDTADPSEYSDGVILKRGSKRIGVFSVDVPLSEKAAESRIKYFRDSKVDLVVCISSVRTYVRNLQGADIVITLQDDEVSTMGGNSNGSFFVNAPHVDSIGAILVSPSNVVSAKVIESL